MVLTLALGISASAHAQSVTLENDTDPLVAGDIDASTDLYIGYGAAGSMTIAGGAQVTSLSGYLGVDLGGNGTVLLTDIGSSWTTLGRLNVGGYGVGSLTIQGGATVASGDAVVGDGGLDGGENEGHAIVQSGGRWNNAGQLTIGSYGSGTLLIEGAAEVTSNQGYIGAGEDSEGRVTVRGAGSSWVITDYNMAVGNFGVGTLMIEDGGLVRAPTGVDLGVSSTQASGTLVMQGTAGNLAVLETSHISAGAGAASASIDGGLLRATASNSNFFAGFGTRDIGLGANGVVIDTGSYAMGISPRFVGAGALTKEGTGVLTLTGTNAYSGGTTIAAGTLRLGNGGTTGSLLGNVANEGTLAFNRSDSVTFAAVISGNGQVTQQGSGTTILTGTNTYLGGTTIANGTLQLGAGGTSGTLLGNVTNNGRFAFNHSDSLLFGGVISGSGAVRQLGTGTVVLTGENVYVGGTLIDAGTLQIGNGGTIGSVVGDIVNNGVLALNRSDLLAIDGTISGSGSLGQIGSSTTVLTANNSYTGATTISGGTLRINGDQSAAIGLTSVLLGGTLGGSGIVGGDVFVDDGGTIAPGNSPGTLTINGDLTLSSSALLDFEFGQADVPGGPLNDLIDVKGDLTLDGTIDVAVSAGGSFAPGLYRALNYGGTLTNNGLELGTMPAGSDVRVVTAIAGQVNLLNVAGATVNLWDGGSGTNKFDNVINGGDGVWQASGGNDNWANETGLFNADYTDGAFAIFTAAPGTVTVDNSHGAVTASGMQFASDGYLVTGDDIVLSGAQSVILVGDGTAAGAGYTAIIASALTGSGDLVKTDLGTLVLTDSSTFAGEGQVRSGALRITDGGTLSNTLGVIAEDSGFTAGVLVSGTGSTWSNNGNLRVGGFGAGTLTIADGGAVNVTDITFVGDDAGSQGAIAVSGQDTLGNASSLVATGGLSIGEFGAGALTVSGGGQVTADNTYVGSNAGAVGTVLVSGTAANGAASALAVATDLLVGSSGTGTLNIEDGGLVTTGGAVSIGQYAGGNGIVTVASSTGDSATLAATDFITVGEQGAATLNVGKGGLVSTGNNLYLAYGATANGTINLTGDATGRGVIETGSVVKGDGTAGLNLDGGVLRATRNEADFLNGFDTLTLGNGGAWIDTNGYAVGIDIDLAGSSGLTKLGLGTLTLTGENTYTGGALIDAGTLQIGNGGTTGSIVGDIADNGVLALDRSDLLALGGTISGSGSVKQIGSGTTVLSGTNSYAGTTEVLAGTLLIDGNQSAATGLTTVAAGATLGGSGTIGGSVDMSAGGTLAAGNGGAGTLTIAGDLVLGSASTLAFDFGQAEVAGGALNDMVDVGGDLTLDGTIDVAVTSGGSFGAGLYRIANYDGTLTDNGLEIGTLPSGAAAFVQTAVSGQVNLVNTNGQLLNFWDGASGGRFDGQITGGDGVWQAASGNDNWTLADGSVNAGYSDGALAIFTGAAGTVTLDDSLGAINASGLQFAVGGYVLTGDTLTLTAPQSTIRIGDGTAAGADYVAAIDSVIDGNAQLVKTDLGTLILSGTNTYIGGTAIDGGTLRIAGDENLGAAAGGLSLDGGTLNTTASFTTDRAVDLAGNGSFAIDTGTTLTLAGLVSGVGALTKAGGGTLTLAAANSYAGGTQVEAGTLLVNGDQSAASGLTSILAGATLGGTGTIGGNVALSDGATLSPGADVAGTLTIAGDLSLSSGSNLDFAFGAANVAGGALNDLVNVGGDLTLDGTIAVSTSAGGSFDVGVYRVFNYDGTLTDNGLEIGTAPAGSSLTVQTSVAGQVNLVNGAGLTLNFWDGTAGPKNNGVIDGRNGVWQNSAGNDNWTDANGAVNGAYADGSFAVFGGTGGTVTVDDSLGEVSVSGMQFAADGYTITGDAVALTQPTTTIRVGDGSTAGAANVATIAAALTGDSQVVKTDAGTLVLSGTNTYTGGTRIDGGTVQIASDANLGAAAGAVTLGGGNLATSADISSDREVQVAGTGAIATADATTFTLTGSITGTGDLAKTSLGTLVLTGNSAAFSGTATVSTGTLAVDGTLGGSMAIAAEGRLEGIGRVGSVTNAGTIAPGRDGFGTLTVDGDYTGAGGKLLIETELGGDASRTDVLSVTGATAGSTTVSVVNRGGLGAATVNGIRIIDVTGASNGTFTLAGDYTFQGEQAVIAGAYGYRLVQNGVDTPNDGDWYLRSSLLDPGTTPEAPNVPLYQPGAPVYEAYGQTLLTLNELGTMRQRIGDRQFSATGGSIWGRIEGQRSRPDAAASTSNSDVNVDSWKMELGADHVLSQRSDGAALILGVVGGYGEASAKVSSVYGDGSIKTKGYNLGATLTWFGPQGFYVDGRSQFTWFDSTLKSATLGRLAEGNNGHGEAYSLEAGKQWTLGGRLSLTPQVQMVYSTVRFDRFADPYGANVSSQLGDSLKTRWGLSIDRQDAKSKVYAVANLSYEWLDGTVVDVSGTAVARRSDRLWGELGLGASAMLGSRLTLYAEASGKTATHDFGNSYALKANAGLRMAF
jgi:fibronectin-binding autotransporter adhesin